MWRPSILVLVAVLALAACGSSQTSRSSSSASTSAARARTVPRCTGLTTTYVGTEGATGHLEVIFALHNSSRRTCHVKGYPGAALLGPSGRILPMKVTRGHGFFPDTLRAPHDVVLRPGGRARFGVSFVTNNEYAGARTCHTATRAVAGMSGWHTPISLRHAPKISPCGEQLVVSPVHT